MCIDTSDELRQPVRPDTSSCARPRGLGIAAGASNGPRHAPSSLAELRHGVVKFDVVEVAEQESRPPVELELAEASLFGVGDICDDSSLQVPFLRFDSRVRDPLLSRLRSSQQLSC